MTASIDAAAAHFRAGRLADAIAACRGILQATPHHAAALNILGAALFSTGDVDGAAAALGEATRHAPGDLAARANLAIVLQHRRAWIAARGHLAALAILDPASPVAFARLGTVLQEIGDLDAAGRCLRRAVRLAPADGSNWLNRGVAGFLAGAFADADAALRRAAAIDPAAAAPQLHLGETLLRLGRTDAAAAAFARALRLDPGATAAVNGLARCRRYRAAAAAAGTGAGGRAGGLAVRGPFLSSSGYGHFCHRLIQGMRARGVPLQAIGIFGDEAWPAEDLGAPVGARALVNCLIPLAVEPVPRLATVTFTMFEGTRIPAAWRRQCERSDLVVVPTHSSRVAWAAAGFPEDRLRLCPLGVDPVDGVDTGPLVLADPRGGAVSRYRHRFLNVSDFVARKNIDGLLRVWLRATRRGDDAALILKIGKGTEPSLGADLAALVRLAEEAVGRRLAEAAPVVLVDQLLAEADMTRLYRAATHYVSLSHGEGWDLPMSKAGTLGLELIAPRHTAYLDYLDDSVAHLVPATVAPALLPGGSEFYPPFHGLDWWMPDEDAAAAIVAGIIAGDRPAPAPARDRLLHGFTWDHAAARLLAVLDEAGLR